MPIKLRNSWEYQYRKRYPCLMQISTHVYTMYTKVAIREVSDKNVVDNSGDGIGMGG